MKNIKKVIEDKKFISLVLSYIVFLSICNQTILIPYNMISIILFVVIYFFIYKIELNNNYKKELVVFSGAFSLVLLVGGFLFTNRYSPTIDFFSEMIRPMNIIYLLGNGILIYSVLSLIVPLVIDYKSTRKEKNYPKIFLISFLVIVICYIPYLIIFFPGIITADSLTGLNMVLKIYPVSDSHTILHLLFMYIPFKIGNLIFNNINISVGLISLTQIVVMALTFAYVIKFLNKRKVPNMILIIILLFYGLLPVNGFYSITLWKDIIFSCSVVLLTIECFKLIERNNNITFKNSYMFVVTSLLVVFTRNNAIYMYVVLSLVSILVFKKNLKVIIPMIIIVFASYIMVKGPIFNALKIEKSSSAEYIAIPLQQIGRMAYKNVEFTKDEKELIDKLIPVEELKKSYNPEITDPIKFNKQYNTKEFEKNKKEYLKLWINLCYKHPKIAIEAYLTSTLGYWYPGVEYWVTTSKIDDNQIGIHIYSFVPNSFREKFSHIISSKIPLIGFFNCIGFSFWLIFTSIYITIKKKGKKILYIYVPVLGIWLTLLIAAPVFAEFRYTYSALLCLPVFIGLLFSNYTNKKI